MHVRVSIGVNGFFTDHDFFRGLVAPKGAVLKFDVVNGASSRPSWVAARPVCWEEHRPGRSLHQLEVCSIPRRFGRPTAGVWE